MRVKGFVQSAGRLQSVLAVLGGMSSRAPSRLRHGDQALVAGALEGGAQELYAAVALGQRRIVGAWYGAGAVAGDGVVDRGDQGAEGVGVSAGEAGCAAIICCKSPARSSVWLCHALSSFLFCLADHLLNIFSSQMRGCRNRPKYLFEGVVGYPLT